MPDVRTKTNVDSIVKSIDQPQSPLPRFIRIKLPGSDYIPGGEISRHITHRINADIDAYNADSWTKYVERLVAKHEGVSFYVCSALDSCVSDSRHWWGYIFSVHATSEDFVKGNWSDPQDARAFDSGCFPNELSLFDADSIARNGVLPFSWDNFIFPCDGYIPVEGLPSEFGERLLAPLGKYEPLQWVKYVQDKAVENGALSYSAYSAPFGFSGERTWLGRLFRSPLELSDFKWTRHVKNADSARWSWFAGALGTEEGDFRIGDWRQIRLPGDDYTPDEASIPPEQILEKLEGDYGRYELEEWIAHVFRAVREKYAQSYAVYSAIDGSTGYRKWFGYVFNGEVSVEEFKKTPGARSAHAFNFVYYFKGNANASGADAGGNWYGLWPEPPSHSIPGPKAYSPPGRWIDTIEAPLGKYELRDWIDFVQKTADERRATSYASWSDINDITGCRKWYGALFNDLLNASDFEEKVTANDVYAANKDTVSIDAQTNGALEAHPSASNGLPNPMGWIRDTGFPEHHPNKPYPPPGPDSTFEDITLPGPNYVVGPPRFFENVIASYNGSEADLAKQLQFVKDEAKKYSPEATSLVFFSAQATNTKLTVVSWFAYIFSGERPGPGDFVPEKGVYDAVAFAVVPKIGA